MKRLLSEYGLFLREFWSNYHTTGAILPSGPWLAAALARYVGKGVGRSGSWRSDPAPGRSPGVSPGRCGHRIASIWSN